MGAPRPTPGTPRSSRISIHGGVCGVAVDSARVAERVGVGTPQITERVGVGTPQITERGVVGTGEVDQRLARESRRAHVDTSATHRHALGGEPAPLI
jgi:hypothetical protein